MSFVGIDLEQFVTDPYGSGIQRVLQNLAREWPREEHECSFVVPRAGKYLLLSADEAYSVISLAFSEASHEDARRAIDASLANLAERVPSVELGSLMALFHSWLLPEVTYLPSALDRFEMFSRVMPCSMIGYDALPMTEPGNYRFIPGKGFDVSRYFRLLAQADGVICISHYAKDTIIQRLRRDPVLTTVVAHPGADHFSVSQPVATSRTDTPVRFLRVGTMEERKMPRELVAAFRASVKLGVTAELMFVGRPSSSDADINADVEAACGEGIGVTWIRDADDEYVHALMRDVDFFVSVGIEGYGIPALEALRLGTPVIYGGVQPAAEIMEEQGAVCIGAANPEDLVQMFVEFSNPHRRESAARSINSDAIPSWSHFASEVARVATTC